MKYTLIVCLFLITLNTFAQTGSKTIEQTFIFELVDENGKTLTEKVIANKEISIMNMEVNNLIFNQLDENGNYIIECNGIRYMGDYNHIKSTDIELIYELSGEVMTINIKNIQTAYLKIAKIPFKRGNYTIDLERESDFIKKLIIEPTSWTKDKVVVKEVKKEKE